MSYGLRHNPGEPAVPRRGVQEETGLLMCQPEQLKSTQEPGPITGCGVSAACPGTANVHLHDGAALAVEGRAAQLEAVGVSHHHLLSPGPLWAPIPVVGGDPLGDLWPSLAVTGK